MDSNGLHIRDRIVLDANLIDSLKLSSLDPRITTLHFIAREVVIHACLIEGYDIVIIADTLSREVSSGLDFGLVIKSRDDAPNGVARPDRGLKSSAAI